MGKYIKVDDDGNIWERVGVVDWAFNVPETRREVQALGENWHTHTGVMPTSATVIKQEVTVEDRVVEAAKEGGMPAVQDVLNEAIPHDPPCEHKNRTWISGDLYCDNGRCRKLLQRTIGYDPRP